MPASRAHPQAEPPAARSEKKTPEIETPPPSELPDLSFYADFSRFEAFCRDCLVIVTKKGLRVPLILNSSQKKVLAVIRRLVAVGVPPRIVILKARQVGISTLIEALLFWDCLTSPNRSALVVAHTLKSSKTLFRMSRNFHRFLPGQMGQNKRIENVHEIEFDSGSRVQVEVQGDPRGYTAQRVHLSEYAFFENPEDTLVAILQTVPMTLDSLAVIESTANGVGNKFHKLWQRAVGLSLDRQVPDEEKGWTPVFIPWFDHEEYRIEVPRGNHERRFKNFIRSSDELRMCFKYPQLTDEQLRWRRWCISSNLDGDEERFAVEYPATAQEAFALSGRPAFDSEAVAHYTEVLAEAVQNKQLPERMEIESDPPGVGKVEIVSHDRGRLRIFAGPRERHTYIIGADPSEGDPGSDPSPLSVLNQQTLDLDATWYGKAPPDLLACYAIDLARHYNEGLIINEANNHGGLFQETVVQHGYQNLYFRKVSPDSVAGEITDKPGYLTTVRSREHLFNTLRKYVRMRMGKLPCPHFVQQMQSLVYIDNKAQAQPGAEKDLLISFALCLMAHRGSMANPLEPLPEMVVRSMAGEILLLRERDPEKASLVSSGLIGMTQEDLLKSYDALDQRDARSRRNGTSGMR